MSEADLVALTADTPTRARWRRLIVWTVVLLVVLSALAWLGLQGYGRYEAQRQLDALVADLNKKEPGWRLDELEAARKPVADGANGALVVTAVTEVLPKPWQLGPPSSKPQRMVDAERFEALRTTLQSVQKALTKARTLADYGEGRFPNADVKDPMAASTHCTDAPDVALLLRMQAMVLAQENDADGALGAVLAIAGAARTVGDEPRSLAQMIRARCLNELAAALERTLAQGQPSEALMARLQRDLQAEEEQTPGALRAALGERAGHHELALAVEAGRMEVSKVFLKMRAPANPIEDALVAPSTATRFRKAHLRVLSLLTQLVAITRLPLHEQGEPGRQLAADWRNWDDDYELFQGLDQRVLRIHEMFRRHRTLLRCAITALALERYRRANGRWPEKLEDLVPALLAKVPSDPFGGNPIRMERRPDGVRVFSPGKEMREGEESAGRPQSSDTAHLAFRLWDVAQRRQQAVANDGEEGLPFGPIRRQAPPNDEGRKEEKTKDQ